VWKPKTPVGPADWAALEPRIHTHCKTIGVNLCPFVVLYDLLNRNPVCETSRFLFLISYVADSGLRGQVWLAGTSLSSHV
jgi:hypothetical protein